MNKKKQRKLFKPIDIIYKPTKRIEIEPLCFFFQTIYQKLIRLFIRAEKKLKEHINVISVIAIIIFLLTHINKKDILKTVQDYQR